MATRDPLAGSIPDAASLTQVSPALGAAFFDPYSFMATADTLSTPSLAMGNLADPLVRNHYAFNRTNPLSYFDPTGAGYTGPRSLTRNVEAGLT